MKQVREGGREGGREVREGFSSKILCVSRNHLFVYLFPTNRRCLWSPRTCECQESVISPSTTSRPEKKNSPTTVRKGEGGREGGKEDWKEKGGREGGKEGGKREG